MSDLLEIVTLVISFFVDWISSLTSSLIQNPVIQLVFAFPVVYMIIRFLIGLILSIFNNNSKSSSNSSKVNRLGYDPAEEPERYLYSGDYDNDQWDYHSQSYY